MSGALPSIQDKWVQFEEEDDGVHGISEFRYYQKKISPPPRPQETAKTPKQISPSQKKHSLSKWQNVKTDFKLVHSLIPQLPFPCGNSWTGRLNWEFRFSEILIKFL